MTPPFPQITKDLFLAHYASASPDEFDAILRANGVIMTREQVWRYAERNRLVRRNTRTADWDDDIRDSSARFAGLPCYQKRERPAAERKPWVCITKRVPDPRVEARRMRYERTSNSILRADGRNEDVRPHINAGVPDVMETEIFIVVPDEHAGQRHGSKSGGAQMTVDEALAAADQSAALCRELGIDASAISSLVLASEVRRLTLR